MKAGALFILLCVEIVASVNDDCYQFDGTSYIDYDLNSKQRSYTNDKITLQFRSSDASGLLLYAVSKGLYSDHILLELVNGKLRVRYQLGQNDTLKDDVVGDGLGDDILSTVTIERKKKSLDISAYGGQSEQRLISIPGADDRLDINANLFVGGYMYPYPSVHNVNFKGCIFKAVFNDIDILEKGVRKNVVITSTPKLPSRALNFEKDTFIKIQIQKVDAVGEEKRIDELFGEFEFRTVVIAGTIFQASSVSMTFQKSQLNLKSTTDVVSLPFPNSGYASDGRWFKIEFRLKNELMWLKLNDQEKSIIPSNPPQVGGEILFGYDELERDQYLFIGCLRNLIVLDKAITYPKLIEPYVQNPIAKFEKLREGCKASDPCVPNPCFHDAECLNYATGLKCDCKKYYMEPLCQFSQYKTSCSEIKQDNSVTSLQSSYFVDPDDSGPLPPVSVQCDFVKKEEGQTEIDTVDAISQNIDNPEQYGENFSFKKKIKYMVNVHAVRAIVQRSEQCEQNVKYECKLAKLFNLQGAASSRWLSTDGYLRYYWGGAQPNSFKCACAYTENGCGQSDDNAYCKCDARRSEKNMDSDEGILNVTNDLPVYEVHFGGFTRASTAIYSIEKLICYGVGALGAVTFVANDGWLRLPAWDSPLGGDISFYIKTIFATGDLIDHRNKQENYIFQVRIKSAREIEVVYSFGSSKRIKIVSKMSDDLSPLNNNEWHRIHVVRTLQEAYVRIDNKATKVVGGEFNGNAKVPLTGDHLSRLDIDLPMFVGAFWRFPTYKTGYIGCMKGFTINGVFYDLANAVDNLAHEPEPLILKGCGNACNVNRCPFGKCVEKYTSYECDCSEVPFDGKYCTEETGANFQGTPMHSAEVNVKTGMSKAEKIVLGFSTEVCSGTLLDMKSQDEKQYYKLSITSKSELTLEMKIVESLPVTKIIITAKFINFCDAARHIVFIERNSSQWMKYKVDHRPIVERKEKSAADGEFKNPYYFYVGDAKDGGGDQYSGCISGVKFVMEMTDGTVKIVEPIKENLKASNTDTNTTSRISCGPTINTPIPMETRTIPGPTTPTDYPSTEFLRDFGVHEAEDSEWVVLIIVALLLMLLLVALVVLIIWYVMQHKRDYQILEKEDGTLVGTATVRGASMASMPAGTSRSVLGARAPSQASNSNLNRTKSKSNDVFV